MTLEQLEQLERQLVQAAERIEPGSSARLLVGYADAGDVKLRRLGLPGEWFSLSDELRGRRLGPAAERLLDVLWPDCDAEIRRWVVMAASMVSKIPGFNLGK